MAKTLLHSERPKLYGALAILSAIELILYVVTKLILCSIYTIKFIPCTIQFLNIGTGKQNSGDPDQTAPLGAV